MNLSFDALREAADLRDRFAPPADMMAANELARDLAILIMKIDAIAARAGIDLGQAIKDTFNAQSVARNSSVGLTSTGPYNLDQILDDDAPF